MVGLPWVGAAYEQAGEGGCYVVCGRRTVVRMHGAMGAKACEVAVACGIAPEDIVGILQGSGVVAGIACETVGIEHGQAL